MRYRRRRSRRSYGRRRGSVGRRRRRGPMRIGYRM